MQRGDSPVVGTAIHDGHALPPGFAEAMAITAEQRQREEDPFTGVFTSDVRNRIVVHQSRFAVDLNRARETAIYLKPEQSWGVPVFAQPPVPELVGRVASTTTITRASARSTQIEAQFGRFVLLDIHSYNHRRDGRIRRPPRPT